MRWSRSADDGGPVASLKNNDRFAIGKAHKGPRQLNEIVLKLRTFLRTGALPEIVVLNQSLSWSAPVGVTNYAKTKVTKFNHDTTMQRLHPVWTTSMNDAIVQPEVSRRLTVLVFNCTVQISEMKSFS